jgi:glycosyltransferase involved in cell wall biosynthesis
VKVIAVYNRYLNRGGEDEVFESEIALLRSHGCEVHPVEEQTQRPTTLLSKISAAGSCLWSEGWHRKFQAILADKRPDIVHVQNCFPAISPSIYYACHEARVPVVQTLHNFRLICPAANLHRNGRVCEECMQHSLWRGVRYGCYQDSHLGTAAVAFMIAVHRRLGTWSRMVDLYITPTEFARQTFIRGGLPADKIKVKPNFVEPDPGVGSNSGEYALFAGRLAEQKGVLTLINAWKLVRPGVPLVVIGDGPLREHLESQLCRPEFSHVEYRGRLTRAETIAAMQSARFLLFPSELYETFGMTVAESFACGVPVICGRLGAVTELVKDGVTGLHFEVRNAANLAEKVEWAWCHPDEMQAMGAAARKEYEARLTGEQNFKILMDLYETVVRSRLSAGRSQTETTAAFRS